MERLVYFQGFFCRIRKSWQLRKYQRDYFILYFLTAPLKSALKPKSMIGSKGSAASRKDSNGNSDNRKAPPDTNYHDVGFLIGDQPIKHNVQHSNQTEEAAEKTTEKSDAGTITTETSGQSRPSSSAEEPMRVAIHQGTLEDMVAMGTVGMEDLHSMVNY